MIVAVLLFSCVNLTGQSEMIGSCRICLLYFSDTIANRSSMQRLASREEAKKVDRWNFSMRNMKILA